MQNAKWNMNSPAPLPLIPSHVNFILKINIIKGGENGAVLPAFLQILYSSGVIVIGSWSLVIGFWDLFGIWCLVLGIWNFLSLSGIFSENPD